MADAIFKGGRRRGFTTVYRDVAQDRRLSLKARGLFLLLQSLPETWQYTISGLATLAGTGKDQIRSGLEAPLSENQTTVGEQIAPLSGNPIPEKPTTGKPSTENPTLIDKEYKKRINKTPKAPKRGLKTPAFVWDCVDNFLGDDPEYQAAFVGLLENREALGNPVLTTRSINTIINKLRKVSREEGIAMLDKAVERNWLTVFPLKDDERPAVPPAREEYGWH